MLTLAVYMRLAVAKFVFLQLEKAGEFVPYLQKGAVLLLAAVDGPGEKAEEIECHEQQLKDPQHDALEKYVDQQDHKIDPEERLIQLVIAVPPVHKADHFILKFHVF